MLLHKLRCVVGFDSGIVFGRRRFSTVGFPDFHPFGESGFGFGFGFFGFGFGGGGGLCSIGCLFLLGSGGGDPGLFVGKQFLRRGDLCQGLCGLCFGGNNRGFGGGGLGLCRGDGSFALSRFTFDLPAGGRNLLEQFFALAIGSGLFHLRTEAPDFRLNRLLFNKRGVGAAAERILEVLNQVAVLDGCVFSLGIGDNIFVRNSAG